MHDVRDLIDALDRLVATSADVAHVDAVEEAAAIAARVRSRRGFLGDTVVVALAGGTGSGKSSLLNAIAGEEVAVTGAMRPTTEEPLAWIPADPEPGLVRLLDRMGVERQVGQDRLPWLAVIDLPDTDSLEVEHRAMVERLLPEVDAVIWVVDPEKYQDRLLHRELLTPLSPYREQFLFALNQVDRVPDGLEQELADDLAATLEADGMPGARIVLTAADPAFGLPQGIDDLVGTLRSLGDAKQVVARKLLVDLDAAVSRLAAAAGVGEGGATGFREEWERVSGEAASRATQDLVGRGLRREARRLGRQAGRRAVAVLGRSRPPEAIPISPPAPGRGVMGAVEVVGAYLTRLREMVGGETAAAVRRVAATADQEVSEAVESVAAGGSIPLGPPPGWWGAGAWVRRLAAAASVLAVIWGAQAVSAGGEALGPALVLALSLLFLVGTVALAAEAGGRWGVAALDARRAEVETLVQREIDRRLGRPLREALRERAALAAVHAEYALARRRMDGREPRT